MLPFINETRLISAYRPTKEKWMDEERKLEVRGAGEALLFVHNNCMAMDMLEDKKAAAAGDDTKRKHKRIKNKSHDGRNQPMIPLGDAQRWDGFTGLVRSEDVPKIKCSDDDVSTEECTTSSLVHIVAFESPRCLKHRSTILRKARPPPAKLTESDANICKPRINRGANIAYMGTTPFRAVDYDHFQMHSRSNRAPPPAPSYHNSNAPFHRQGPPPRFTPAPQQQQHLPGMRNPFVAQHNNHNQHQHHHHHHRQFPPPPPHPGNPGHHFGGPPPPSAPTFRFQHPNGSNNNHNYGGRQHPPQNFNHGPPRPSAPRFTFSNPRGSQPPPRPPQQQQQHRMSDLRNQLRSTLNGGRGARHVRGPQSNHGQQQSRRY
uniref:Uncharacterized protein n=1 Tax=Leptocylindrus danicus TaxID=163516 RepID=A0A7S2LE68_9STRA